MIGSDRVWDMICQIVLWNVFLLLHLIDDFGKRLHLLLADVQNTTEPVIVEVLSRFPIFQFLSQHPLCVCTPAHAKPVLPWQKNSEVPGQGDEGGDDYEGHHDVHQVEYHQVHPIGRDSALVPVPLDLAWMANYENDNFQKCDLGYLVCEVL